MSRHAMNQTLSSYSMHTTTLQILALTFAFSLASQAITVAQEGGDSTRVYAAFPATGTPPTPEVVDAVLPSDEVKSDSIPESDAEPEQLASYPPEIPVVPEPAVEVSAVAVAGSVATPQALSVGPLESSILPKDRPDWIAERPKYDGDEHFFVVNTIPFSDDSEAETAMDTALLNQVQDYFNTEVLHADGAAQQLEGLDVKLIRDKWLDPDFVYRATIKTEQGPYQQDWTRVSIDKDGRRAVEKWWREIVQQRRLANTGLSLVGIISVIGLGHLSVQALSRRKSAKA